MSIENPGSEEVDAVRRVVTGHDVTGKAVVISDTTVGPTSPDFGQKWSIWAADSAPSFPSAGAPPAFAGPLLPKHGGLHVMVFTLPPRFNPDELQNPNSAELAEAVNRHAESKDDTHPVVHDPEPRRALMAAFQAQWVCMRQHLWIVLCRFQAESVLVLEDCEVRLRAGDWSFWLSME